MAWPDEVNGPTQALTTAQAANPIDLSLGSPVITLTANVTLGALSGMVADREYTITFKQDATGGRLPTVPAGISLVSPITAGLANEIRTFRIMATSASTGFVSYDSGWNGKEVENDPLWLANKCGFKPGVGINNTNAFANYFAYCATTKEEDMQPLWLLGGIYETDYIKLAASDDQFTIGGLTSVTRIHIKCLNGVAILKARPSSITEFLTIGRGIARIQFSNITVRGIGATNPNQAGAIFRGRVDPRWGWGGLDDNIIFHNFICDGFAKQTAAILGSLSGFNKSVNQAIQFQGTTGSIKRPAGNHLPALLWTGQGGQEDTTGIFSLSGVDRLNNAGPNLYLGGHPDFDVLTPTGAATANIFTLTTFGRQFQTCKPFRPLPLTGTLPTGFTPGTTVYASKTGFKLVGFASSETNALAGTLITTTGGTAGFGFVPIWASAVDITNNTITFENQLMATDGDAIQIVGTNTPGGLTANTAYYLRPFADSFNTYQFYDTYAHATAGGATGLIDITTTGTLADFGFRIWGSDGVNAISPIYVNLGYLTGGQAEIGALIVGTHARGEPYLEYLQCAFEVINGGQLNINDGELAGVGDGSSAIRTGAVIRAQNSGVFIGSNRPIIRGETDKVSEIAIGSIQWPDGIHNFFNTTGNAVANPNNSITAGNQVPVSAANGGSLDVGIQKWVFSDGSATVVNWLYSKLVPLDRLVIRVHSGTLEFGLSGNIRLGGKSSLRVRKGQHVEFQLSNEYFNVFELIGVSSDWNTVSQNIALVATQADCAQGLNITYTTALTASQTLPTVLNPLQDDILTMLFTHDNTATDILITLPAEFKGTLPTSGAAASGKKLICKWQYLSGSWYPINNPVWL